MRFFRHKEGRVFVAVLGDRVRRLMPFGAARVCDEHPHRAPLVVPTVDPAVYEVRFAGRSRLVRSLEQPGRLVRPLPAPAWRELGELDAVRYLMTAGAPAAADDALEWFERVIGTARRARDLLDSARPILASYAGAAAAFLEGFAALRQAQPKDADPGADRRAW